jgi:hypothetical protein
MGIASRRLDVGVIEGFLHDLEIAGFSQKSCGEVVSKIMKAKSNDTRPVPQPLPRNIDTPKSQGISASSDLALVGAFGDSGENEFRIARIPAWVSNF